MIPPLPPPTDATDSPPTAPRRKRGRIGLILLLLAAVGAGIYAVQTPTISTESRGGGKRFDPGARVMPVVAHPVTTGDININLHGLGTVTPNQTVVIRSRVDGQLMRLRFQEGQMVKVGDLLAEIDERPFKVQLAQAEGQMAKDQAALANAINEAKRYRTLVAQDSIARQQLETQETLVRQNEGTIQVDQAQIDTAQLQLSYTRITSPIDGRVGLRQVDPGNMIRSSDPNGLAVITQLQPITVIFSIPADNLPILMGQLRSGEVLPVDLLDREQKNLLATGELLTVDNQIDASTGMVRLKAQFANQDGGLFPNQFVNARLRVEVRRGMILAPSAAIQRGIQGSYVYLLNPDQTVSVRPVKTGPAEGDRIVIESGLTAGELVVVDGADKLREGSRVERIQPTPTDAKPSSAPNTEKKRREPGRNPP